MSLPFENELLREQARQQRQREGGQHTDLSDRISLSPLSPIGVGTPNFDIEALLATIPSPEPLVVSPAGQGTNTLDYNKREDVVKAVSTVAFLPAGKNREALIRQFNITQQEVQAARASHNATLIQRGQPPVSVFPTIIWPRVNRPPPPPSRRAPARRVGVTTATTTRPTVTTPQPTATSTPSTTRRGMHDRLDQLTQQVHQDAQGRRIRNITHTNTITTVYEEPGGGQRPIERRTSTRTGAGRRTRRSRQSTARS